MTSSTHFARQAKMTNLGFSQQGRFGDGSAHKHFQKRANLPCVLLDAAVTVCHLRPRGSPCALSYGCSTLCCGGSLVRLTKQSLSVLSKGLLDTWAFVSLCSLARIHPRFLLAECGRPGCLGAGAPRAASRFDVVADIRPFEAVGAYFR